MSKSDAERAMGIYRTFTHQTDLVVSYLSTARTYEHQTRVEVPKLKHAPVNLGKQLADYLADPDFEINRRQYIAEQEAKRFKKGGIKTFTPPPGATASSSKAVAGKAFPDARPATASTVKAQAAPAKGPDPDLIDFFDSIEQNQQPLATAAPQQQQMNIPTFTGAPQFQQQVQQPQPFQHNGFAQPQVTGYPDPQQLQQQQQVQQQQQPQQFNPAFLPQQPPQPQLQPNFTGAGFGGYTPQPQQFQSSLAPIIQMPTGFPQQQQQGLQPFPTGQQQQPTNPFRASMMMHNPMSNPLSAPPPAPSLAPQSTNPFAKPGTAPPSFAVQAPQQQPIQFQVAPPPLQPAPTGTNPFARAGASGPTPRPATSAELMPQATGAGGTNPFRQSQFVNTATGVPWQQQVQTPIGGGLDAVQTIEVFPRPGQHMPWGQ
jgi:hypothetical protein